jgi:hypothetical protein
MPTMTSFGSLPALNAPKTAAADTKKTTKTDAKKDDKKKKKKKDLAVQVPQAKGFVSNDNLNSPSATTTDSLASQAGSTPPSPPTPLTSGGSSLHASQSHLSLQQWEALLLNQPNASETQEFIALFKANKVSSTIFYTIVQKMIQDSREPMELLGVTAAAAVQSYQSFDLLVSAESSSNSSSQAQVTQAAQTALQKYASVNQLGILETVLRTTSTPNADIEAANLLTSLATTLAASKGSSTTSYASQFQPFVTLLQNLTSTPSLASSAQAALNAIQPLLA